MTVDNSQFAPSDVIVLQATTAAVDTAPVLAASPLDSGKRAGRRSSDLAMSSDNKVCQQRQHEQQKQPAATEPRRQALPSGNNEEFKSGTVGEKQNATNPAAASTAPVKDNDAVAEEEEEEEEDAAAAPVVKQAPTRAEAAVEQAINSNPAAPAATSAAKWVRVGEKVCFSTIVAAVLIPSSHDLTVDTKRELWWQPTDYAEFRVNYATHMHNPSIELEEQEREETMGPAPVVPTTANADTPASTATVEGVLVVAASPAPAPLAARPVNPVEATAGASGRRHGNGGGGGNHKVGISGGGGAAAPSQERGSKSYRQERRQWSPAGPNRSHQHQHQHQHKSPPTGPRRVSVPAGYPQQQQVSPHHASHMRQQYPNVHPQQQPVMMMRGHPGYGNGHAAAAGLGRRDARHDRYLAPRGVNMNNAHHHHNGAAAAAARHVQQQQLFVNGNPSGVNCPPQQHQQQQRMSSPAFRGVNANGPVVQAFLPHQAPGGLRGGVATAPATLAFPSRSGMTSPPHSAVAGGVVGNGNPSSQFSMWRSQLVFAPAMQMQ
ncbi:unnamed protein product [Ectocarpus sp. 13 AM-2016]